MRWISAVLLLCNGCISSGGSEEVVVYAALDREFSEPVLADFHQATGITVLPKFDVESTKTVGLTQAILAEASRPRCDVFWNNEILNTLRLEQRGLLTAFFSPAAESYPEMYRSSQGMWYGFAGRARVILVNTKLVPESERPHSIYDLTKPEWRAKAAMAKPLFGTTATHCACLYAHLGRDKAEDFLRSIKTNGVQILSGNKQVALAVASGQVAFGLTDTDDAIIELEKGLPVAIVYPDQQPDQMGTLFIPNTVCILKNCPHPENAKKLVNYLLSPDVEAKLAQGASAQIPLNTKVTIEPRIKTPNTIRGMKVNFAAAAKQWNEAAQFLREQFAE